jgi:hypothetical protein
MFFFLAVPLIEEKIKNTEHTYSQQPTQTETPWFW